MTEQICVGCGAPLQSEFPNQPGYLPRSALERNAPVCRRCFRITHYGEFSRNVVPDAEYDRQVERIREHPGIVLYVLDVFDLSGSLVRNLDRYVQGSRVVLIVNKVDLLPVDINYLHLTDWIRQTVQKSGVDPEDVIFTSASSDIGIDVVVDALAASAADTAYVVGMANVGKSSLLNRLLQHLDEGEVRFTVSKVPGTTLGMSGFDVTLPQGKTSRLVDTPGLIHGTRLSDVLCESCLVQAVPSTRLRPRIFQLNPEQTLFLGNAARFDFVAGVRQSVVCYVSNDLVVHRTKLERADAFMAEHQDDILQVPCPSCRAALGDFRPRRLAASREYQETYPESLKIRPIGADIALPGLGWIALSGQPVVADLWLPKAIRPVIRPRLIGQLNRMG